MNKEKYIKYAEECRSSFKQYDDIRDVGLEISEKIHVIENISYGKYDSNLLDIYFPKNAEVPYKTIVSVHGGAYVYGDKERYRFYCADLAARGFAVVNFSYRLAPENPYPAALEDVNSVFRHISEKAYLYNIDLKNIFVVGDSAGAQLASQYVAMLTNQDFREFYDFEVFDTKIKGCAFNCGMYDLKNLIGTPKLSDMLETYLQDRAGENCRQFDVIGHITSAFPPTFIMTAYYDFLKDEAVPLKKTLEEKNVPHIFRFYGNESERHMAHVFHLNIRTKEAIRCNDDECGFFDSLI